MGEPAAHVKASNVRAYHLGEIDRLQKAIDQHQAIVDAQDAIIDGDGDDVDGNGAVGGVDAGTDIAEIFEPPVENPDGVAADESIFVSTSTSASAWPTTSSISSNAILE